jgi:hypothetical protein
VRQDVNNANQPKVTEHKINNYSKTMETNKRIAYVQRKADGVTLDIPAKHLEETLKRGGFIFVGYADEAPVSPPPLPPQAEFQCPICGFEAKSKLGLAAHNRKHDG